MKVLLDTCTLIWLSSAPDRLSEKAKETIEQSSWLGLSDASVLELVLKHQSGKLELPQPPRVWIEEQTHIWHVQPIELSREVLYRVSELPVHHADSVDRILVATALTHSLVVVTPDPYIHRYPVRTLW